MTIDPFKKPLSFTSLKHLLGNLKKTYKKPFAFKGDDRQMLDDLFYALQCKIDGLLVQPENEGYVNFLMMKASLHFEAVKVKLTG